MSLVKSIGGKNVNFDFNKEFLSIFSDKIKASDIKFINQTLADLHPSDVANLIENLSSEARSKLLEIEEFDIDPEIFVEINEAFIKNNAVFAHGFTNSGNPLACAAASTAIDIYKDDKLIENSAAMGKKIESYKDMLLSHPTVKDMRGWGLMWVLEMVENKDSGEYFSIEKGAEGTFHSIAMQNGLVFYSTMYGRRREPLFKRGLPLMISPPLCINESQIEEMMDKVDHSISLWEAEMGVA